MPVALDLDIAQQRLLALAEPLPAERLAPRDAVGRFLASPLHAARTQPAGDMSAMDGFAVHNKHIVGPWCVVGESAAGKPFVGQIGPGEAVRISTGALVPVGADTVIVQEDVEQQGDRLSLHGFPPRPYFKHIRHEGNDFQAGALLLTSGTRLGAGQIALAVSSGCSEVFVHRRPQIALIESGDELVLDPARYSRHQIPASNGVMVGAMLADMPCLTALHGPVPDDVGALLKAFDDARDADVIVTTGGASVGDHDILKPALTQWGADVDFWRVAIKPGKPLLVARRKSQIIIGLPGNPAASFVTAHLFLLPLLRRLLGANICLPRTLIQSLATPLPDAGDRREFIRGRWREGAVEPVSSQDSGALTSLAAAELLIERQPSAPAAAIGSPVTIHLL